MKSIKETAEPDLKEGLVPFTLFRGKGFRVTSVCQSDIGFTVFGFEDGNVSIVDLRGPAVILEANLMGYAKPGKRLSVRRSASNQTSKSEWPSAIEFAVMSLEGDGKMLSDSVSGAHSHEQTTPASSFSLEATSADL